MDYHILVAEDEPKIRMILQDYFHSRGDRVTPAENGLQALVENVDNNEKWNGPYIKPSVPKDPWGNAYVYACPGEHGDYDLVSYGADGQPGGEGDNADITNWE